MSRCEIFRSVAVANSSGTSLIQHVIPREVEGSRGETLRRLLLNLSVGLADLPEMTRGTYCAFNTSIKASWGMLMRPMLFIRFFPSFCFSNSLRFRVISPP
jgi:hypothetical protein